MSVHSSLRYDKFKNKKITVRKKWERVKALLDKGQTFPMDIFHLPKEKVMKMRVKPKTEKKVVTTVDLIQSIIEKKAEEK